MPHLPVRVYALEVPPGDIPVPADFEELPASLRITMAAIDPSAPAQLDSAPSGQTTARATLKIIKVTSDEVDSEDDSEEDEDYDSDDIAAIESRLRGAIGGSEDDSEDDESDDSEEGNGGPSDPTKTKKARKEAAVKALLESLKEDADMEDVEELSNDLKNSKGKERASDDDEEDDSEIESEDDSEVEEFVICTLDPTQHYQQPIDITIGENEQVFFKVIGTHSVYLTGNYIADVKEDSEDDEDYDEDYYGDGLEADSDDYDEDSDDLDDLDDPRITEIDSEEEEAPQLVKAAKKGKNKRPADESEEDTSTLDALISKSTKSADAAAASSEKLSKKQAKKLKNNQGQAVASAELNGTNGTPSAIKKDANGANGTPNSAKSDKKVQFAKNLEQGPTGSPLPKADNKAAAKDEKKDDGKPKASLGVKVVQGVKIDDKKLGKGPAAKKGDRVGMRYIGKLESNGQVFDSNKKGAPFSFKLGKGEVIQGWDIGVAGMSVGGERRLTIPAKLAYKNQKVPGIPPNSTLVFDVKLVEIK